MKSIQHKKKIPCKIGGSSQNVPNQNRNRSIDPEVQNIFQEISLEILSFVVIKVEFPVHMFQTCFNISNRKERYCTSLIIIFLNLSLFSYLVFRIFLSTLRWKHPVTSTALLLPPYISPSKYMGSTWPLLFGVWPYMI